LLDLFLLIVETPLILSQTHCFSNLRFCSLLTSINWMWGHVQGQQHCVWFFICSAINSSFN